MDIQKKKVRFPGRFSDAYRIQYHCAPPANAAAKGACLHVHAVDELRLVRQGEFTHYIGDKSVHFSGACLIFTPAGQPHRTDWAENAVYERYILTYSSARLKDISLPLAGLKSFVCPLTDPDDALFAHAELLMREYQVPRMEKAEPKIEKYLLTALLLRVYETAKKWVDIADTRLPYICGVQQYIQDNITRPISVKELTDAFFVCRAKLSRDFREYSGVTITGYIRLLRMEYAKELLRAGESVRATAAALGYEYESTFISAFKSVTGMTPLQFKRTAEK